MEKDFYFVRLPSFERPPIGYGEKSGKIYSTMARSNDEAIRNVVVREFNKTYRLVFDFLSKRFYNPSSYSVNARNLLDSISPFDERGKRARCDRTSMVYFLAGELGSCFGLKPESMIPYAEEFLATLPNQ